MVYVYLIQKIWLCAVSDLATIRLGNTQNYDPVPKDHTMQPYMATGGGGKNSQILRLRTETIDHISYHI
jgi:hypothetical protein